MSAYGQMKTAIESIVPAGWKFTAFEPQFDVPDVTGLTLKLRSVSRLGAAPAGVYQVDWILTITSGSPSRETADPQLFDDLLEFLTALDGEPTLGGLGWTEATKTVGDDEERLAYDITIQTESHRTPPDEPAETP